MSSPKNDRLGRPIRQYSEITCVDCGCGIGVGNSRYGRAANKAAKPRCGFCYLKFRANIRKAKGLL